MNFKKRLFATLGFVLITAAISCKKEKAVSQDSLANTTWAGTFIVKNDGGDPLAVKFGEDKKITLFFGNLNAPAENQCKGTYTFANNKLLFSVTDFYNEKISLAGTLTNNTITGTWGRGNIDKGEGTFSMIKK
ncbi:MAG TPA: hypothetical protein PKE30_05605 [Niabella sp.]|nr:hypothetical protein [Niabella sp.]